MIKNEIELIDGARKGDNIALTEIVNRYSDKLYTLLFRILRDNEEAEDALQETFITMIEKIEQFKGESGIYTWLYRIAVNNAMMRIRSGKEKYKVAIEDEKFDSSEMNNSIVQLPENPEELLNQKELKAVLKSAVDSLPGSYRAVFVLRDIEQLSIKETAEILSISHDNVKTRLRRARIMLRDTVAERF